MSSVLVFRSRQFGSATQEYALGRLANRGWLHLPSLVSSGDEQVISEYLRRIHHEQNPVLLLAGIHGLFGPRVGVRLELVDRVHDVWQRGAAARAREQHGRVIHDTLALYRGRVPGFALGDRRQHTGTSTVDYYELPWGDNQAVRVYLSYRQRWPWLVAHRVLAVPAEAALSA